MKEWRTFKAVLIRNLKLFTAYKAWIVATIIWPIVLLALNVYTYKAFGTDQDITKALEISNISFHYGGMIIVGSIVYLLYNRLLWGTGNTIQSERWMGTIEALFLTPANKMTILLASGMSTLAESSWWICLIFFISSMFFGIQINMASLPTTLICILSTMMALVSIGMFFAAFFVLTRAAYRLAEGLQAPIRFFSGVAFPVSALPQLLQYISFLIPVTWGIMTLRTSLLRGGTIESVWLELIALYIMTAAFLMLAYFFLKKVERQTKKKGTLYLF